jgi:hypothetical protein
MNGSSKASYDINAGFGMSQPMAPEWKAGQGQNSHPAVSKGERLKYNIIEIGKTQVDAKSLYKIMLGNIGSSAV